MLSEKSPYTGITIAKRPGHQAIGRIGKTHRGHNTREGTVSIFTERRRRTMIYFEFEQTYESHRPYRINIKFTNRTKWAARWLFRSAMTGIGFSILVTAFVLLGIFLENK
jgi:hypothetical protein